MPPFSPRRLLVAVMVTALAMVALVASPDIGQAADPTTPGTTAPSSPTAPPSASAGDNDYQVLHDDYEKVLADQAIALRRLADTVQKRQGTQVQLLSIELQIQATGAKLDSATVDLLKANAARDRAVVDLANAERALAASKSELKSQVLSSYVTGGQKDDGLDSVLDKTKQQDGQTQTYASAVVRHQKAVIRAYDQAKAERDRQARLADDAEAKAKSSRDDISAFKSALERNKADQAEIERNLALEQLNEQLQFNDLDKTKVSIVDKVVGLARDGDGITSLVNQAQAGQLPFVFPMIPLVDPTPGAVYTQGFGSQKQAVLGVQGSHPGIDLAGPAGAEVHTSGDGVVIVAGPLGGYGNAVIIDHGTHLSTLYGHNEQVLVTVGQKVKQNDVIARRGSTGFSTGPHVHFETRVNGVPVDPLLFVRLS